MMSWTVACFCGNVYTTPPDCCEVCGRSTEPALVGGVAASQQGIGERVGSAAGPLPSARSRKITLPCLTRSENKPSIVSRLLRSSIALSASLAPEPGSPSRACS
jgi:hypothetical protein